MVWWRRCGGIRGDGGDRVQEDFATHHTHTHTPHLHTTHAHTPRRRASSYGAEEVWWKMLSYGVVAMMW